MEDKPNIRRRDYKPHPSRRDGPGSSLAEGLRPSDSLAASRAARARALQRITYGAWHAQDLRHRSPTARMRPAIVRSVKFAAPPRSLSTSSQVHGADTGAPGLARTA